MSTFQSRPIPWIIVGLASLMAATRFHHESTIVSLPDASLAVFFLSGRYLRIPLALTAFLLTAFVIDYVAIIYGNVSSYCISPAYIFLLPAYAAMWWAGRWTAAWPRSDKFALLRYVTALFVATSAAFLITEISFFLFSERESAMDWISYREGMMDHYPEFLIGSTSYCGAALFLEWLARIGSMAAGYHLKPK